MNDPQVATRPADRQCRKCLIVTGDDFGRSAEVNEAVERFHRAGLLTQASLMVNEPGVEEAVRIARRNPGLTVGLHLTLCSGRASGKTPLADGRGFLPPSPAWAGLRYAFDRALRPALRAEIEAQFEAFAGLGFPPVYWDGHTHLHLHPAVFDLTLPVAVAHGFRAVRLVREAGGAPLAVIFRLLSRRAAGKLGGIHFADRIVGLRHTGRMNTRRIAEALKALESLPSGWTELYFHPGAEPEAIDGEELAALAARLGVRLASTRDLAQDRER